MCIYVYVCISIYIIHTHIYGKKSVQEKEIFKVDKKVKKKLGGGDGYL